MAARERSTRSAGRGRAGLLVLALLLALVAGMGLAACGDDDSSDAATEPSASPEQLYAEGLADAARAVGRLASAVVSGESAEDTANDIRSASSDWEAAIGSIEDVDLSGSLASQRDALVDDSPAFVDAWNEVADEWAPSPANGVLELVQRRTPILNGVEALRSAVRGGLSDAGEAARSRLENAQSELTDSLSEIRGALP